MIFSNIDSTVLLMISLNFELTGLTSKALHVSKLPSCFQGTEGNLCSQYWTLLSPLHVKGIIGIIRPIFVLCVSQRYLAQCINLCYLFLTSYYDIIQKFTR